MATFVCISAYTSCGQISYVVDDKKYEYMNPQLFIDMGTMSGEYTIRIKERRSQLTRRAGDSSG